MTVGKQWKRADLRVDDIREREGFQWRLLGRDPNHVNTILRTLEANEETRDPIRVARVGEVLYVVDGFHRLEAYRRAGRATIPAEVAKMSIQEATDYSQAANGMNGKPYSRADKTRLWETFVAEGRHLDAFGSLKPSRTIAADLPGRFYSHETVRTKLKALGLELDEDVEYGGVYKPMISEQDLAAERAEDAEESLRSFGRLLPDLEPFERARLLQVARSIQEAWEGNESPDLVALFPTPLDI